MARASTLVNRELTASSSDAANYIYIPYTPWRPSTGVVDSTIDTVLKIQNVGGSVNVTVAIQYAAVTSEEADDWIDLGTAQTQATVAYQAIDLSGNDHDDKYYYRLGIGFKSGGDQNSIGTVKLSATTNVQGAHLGGATIDTKWGSTTTVYSPLTGWYPAQVVDKVKAAYMVTGQSGLEYGLVYRTMNSNLEPTPWGDWETVWDSPQTDNDRRNSGEIDETGTNLSNKLFVQFGLGYKASSTLCYGTVKTDVSVIEK